MTSTEIGSNINSLWINLLGGILVILLDRLYIFLKTRLKSYRFKNVFGKDVSENFKIIYGKMLLKQVFDKNGKPEKYPYFKFNNANFVISEPVSFTETKSAKYISDSIAKNTKSAATIISDEEVKEKLDVSYCSIGGYNNYKTIDIIKAENNYYVDLDISPWANKIVLKTDPKKEYRIDDEHDYAILIKLKNKNFPNRTQICAAGLGESGTSGASWFLANKWKVLEKKAKRNDFGCIIKVKFGKDESAEIEKMITSKDIEEK